MLYIDTVRASLKDREKALDYPAFRWGDFVKNVDATSCYYGLIGYIDKLHEYLPGCDGPIIAHWQERIRWVCRNIYELETYLKCDRTP